MKKRKRKEERKKEEEGNGRRKGRRFDCSLHPFPVFGRPRSRLVHAPRGRGFSYTGSFSLKGHQWPYSSVPTLGLSFGIVWDSLWTVHD